MFAFRFSQRVRFLSVAVFAVIAVFAVAVPVRADELPAVPAAAHAAQAKRGTASLGNGMPSTVGAPQGHTGYATGFLYFPGAQPGMNIGGRVNVGKSHVYVPYYGNISNDPTHPGVQGAAGIAYGFRTWDISVLNGGGTNQSAIPGADAPKANPSLSLSIRF
jgi:hypothetical protein